MTHDLSHHHRTYRSGYGGAIKIDAEFHNDDKDYTALDTLIGVNEGFAL